MMSHVSCGQRSRNKVAYACYRRTVCQICSFVYNRIYLYQLAGVGYTKCVKNIKIKAAFTKAEIYNERNVHFFQNNLF